MKEWVGLREPTETEPNKFGETKIQSDRKVQPEIQRKLKKTSATAALLAHNQFRFVYVSLVQRS
ncbi:hypothetical protein HanIR_Chr16g0812431 [Helianthus annuus]|nr:hypothetical protein HanIR_Chr16g0812431 [Helianthus annuus]